jgi:hypothetical protein
MALKVTTEGLTEGEIAEVIGCRVGAVGLREVGASVRTTHVAEGPAAKKPKRGSQPQPQKDRDQTRDSDRDLEPERQ